jgi:hypothetical protein
LPRPGAAERAITIDRYVPYQRLACTTSVGRGQSDAARCKRSLNVAVDPYAHFETMRTRGLSDGTGLSEVILEAEAWCA